MEATCSHKGLARVAEDPSNANRKYDRVRVRQMIGKHVSEIGTGIGSGTGSRCDTNGIIT